MRISDGILQLLNFQRSGFGGGDFCVNYASMPLFLPRDGIVLEPGGRLTGRQYLGQIDQMVAIGEPRACGQIDG